MAIFPPLFKPPLPFSLGVMAEPPVPEVEGPEDNGGLTGSVIVVTCVIVLGPFPVSVVMTVDFVDVVRGVLDGVDVVELVELVEEVVDVVDVVLVVDGSVVEGGSEVVLGKVVLGVEDSKVVEGTGGGGVLVATVVREVVLGDEGGSCVGGRPVLVELVAMVKT